ncbi:MAG: glycosyltransferase family 2 protein [Phycisphaeraceae bacterium]|nr:glycosyltransferase family 2 protein [Phycisphaeraceae bacterium]
MTSALPLSVAIPCKNSERTIGRTLESLRGLASEIIGVDSGSEDGTIRLLEEVGARVERITWAGYNDAAQRALEMCTQPWAMILDSDESIEPELAASMRSALSAVDDSICGFAVNRRVWYRGRFLNHAWQPEWRVRIVRRRLVPDSIRYQGLDPHGSIALLGRGVGRFERLSGILRHDTITDMASFMAQQVRWASAAARSLHAGGARGSYWKLLTSPPGAFLKQMVLKQAWRDGWRGWCAAAATTAATLVKHAILLDLSRESGPREGGGSA